MEAEKVNANPTVNKRKSSLLFDDHDVPGSNEHSEDYILLGKLNDFLSEAKEAAASPTHDSPPRLRDEFTSSEIFSLIRNIRDPEHPLSLEELNVVSEKGITVDDARGFVVIQFTPTVPHCSMSTLIGLCLRVRLLRALPTRFKVDIFVEPGSHVSESQVNKQLNDKERVAAALENTQLLSVVNKCLI